MRSSTADNVYEIGNPGEGIATIYPVSYPTTADFAMPKPKARTIGAAVVSKATAAIR